MRTFKFKAVSVAISMALALALPFGVMAADFSDGAAAEDTWDDVEFDAPVEGEVSGFDFGFGADFDEPDFAPSEASDEFGADFSVSAENPQDDEYKFYFMDDTYPDGTVVHDGKVIGVATEKDEFPATCEEGPSFQYRFTVGESTKHSETFYYNKAQDEKEGALGHTPKKLIISGNLEKGCTNDNDCPCEGHGVEITSVQQCTRCGKYEPMQGTKYTDDVSQAKTTKEIRVYEDHDFGAASEAVTVVLDKDLKNVLTETPKKGEEAYIVTYRLCKNEGCNHVLYDISRYYSLEFKGNKPGENVLGQLKDKIAKTEYTATELTTEQANDIELVNCEKDGSIIAEYKQYVPKKDIKAVDAGKLLTIEKDKENDKIDYTFFDKTQVKEDNITNTIKVPAHHTYVYKYVLKDKNLAKGNVAEYVNIVKKSNPLQAAETVEKDGVTYYNLDSQIGNSKYCVPFEVEVIKSTICATPANHESKKQIETSEGVVTASATPGVHMVPKELINAVQGTKELKNLDDKVLKKALTFDDVDILKDPEGNGKIVVVTLNVTDCRKGGTGTAAYKCEFCGEAVASTKASFKIKETPGHKFTSLKKTEVVPATCMNEGSYIPVMVCEYCGIESVGTKQIVPKTDHVFDGVSPAHIHAEEGQIVVGNMWGPGNKYAVGKEVGKLIGKELVIGELEQDNSHKTPVAVVTLNRVCTVCGNDVSIVVNPLKATVTKVVKEGADGVYCKEGFITVKVEGTPADKQKSDVAVSGEVTFRYYSSPEEYKARYSAHTPSAVVKSNEVEPTETEAGGYDETISCIFCGKVISQRHVTIPALGHTHSMVAVEAKEATCTEDGNIAYYLCEKCGLKYKTEAGAPEDQLTDEEVIKPKTGHDINLVEAKDATCVDGHAAYYVCHNCGEIFKDAEGKEPISYDEVKIEATEEHTPADPVPETREGKVFSVVYCSRCGTELSVEPYKPEEVAPLEAPKTFELKANKPLAGYMEFKLSEVEGAEKYRVSYREVGTDPYTRQESVDPIVKVEELERGKIYEFTACAGDVVENVPIKWGARALNKKGNVKYIRRWYETVEQSKIAKKGSVVTLEWTALADASKYVIYIADNKAMKNAKEVDTSNLGISLEGGKIKVSADLSMIPGFEQFPAGTTMKFYVRIRPYTMYGEDLVAGGYSNLRAKTIKF